MATLVGIFKRSEYKKLLPLLVQNNDSCDSDIETMEPLRDQDYIALFRLGSSTHYECEGLRALGSWFYRGNNTLFKSRAIVGGADQMTVLVTAGIQPPPPPDPPPPPPTPPPARSPRSVNVTMRRRRSRGDRRSRR